MHAQEPLACKTPGRDESGAGGQRVCSLHPAVLSSHLHQPHLLSSAFPTLTPDPIGAAPPSVSGFLDSKLLPTASRAKPTSHSPYPTPHTIICGRGQSRQSGTDPVSQSSHGWFKPANPELTHPDSRLPSHGNHSKVSCPHGPLPLPPDPTTLPQVGVPGGPPPPPENCE